MNMMDDIKEHIKDYHDEEAIEAYLDKLLNKQAYDHKGLIYGMGHAVYSLSDPREKVFKSFVEQLAAAKEELQPMKDIRYWVSKVLTPEQSEVEKKPEPKHSVTEKMKFLQEQSSNQQEQNPPQQKKQNMEL